MSRISLFLFFALLFAVGTTYSISDLELDFYIRIQLKNEYQEYLALIKSLDEIKTTLNKLSSSAQANLLDGGGISRDQSNSVLSTNFSLVNNKIVLSNDQEVAHQIISHKIIHELRQRTTERLKKEIDKKAQNLRTDVLQSLGV